MEKIIVLEFNNTISRLAGNSYGKTIFESQVRDKINYKGKNVIEIPSNIEDIAISFVQGFTEEIFKNITRDDFNKYFEVKAIEKVVNKFYKSIYF